MAKKDKNTETKEKVFNFLGHRTEAEFKIFNKKLDELYSNESSLNKRLSYRSTNRSILAVRTKEDLKREIENSLDDAGKLAESSKILHSIDPNYQKIISYYADMFYMRYTVTPVKTDFKKDGLTGEEYLNTYFEMMEMVDGISIETIVPVILQQIFITGSAYITTEKNNAAKTVSTIILPSERCKTTLKTNMGTNIIEFDFSYFDQFTKAEDLKLVFEIFPKEFDTLYKNYLKNKNIKYHQLDPRYSTSFMKNDKGLPPFLNALDGILEYEQVRGNELQKSENELKKIFVHEIPIQDGEPIFDLNEVTAIQTKIAAITREHDGLDTITTFGKSALLNLQDDGKMENKRIQQAFKTIYNAAGMNSNIFDGTIAEALKINLQSDKAMVWSVIKTIENFLNLAANTHFKFKGYQAEINFLPITIYDEEEQVNRYLSQSTFGIGKIEAIVSSGIKQKHIHDKYQLEKELNLENILIPLKSSHTTTDNTVGNSNGNEDQNTGGDEDE